MSEESQSPDQVAAASAVVESKAEEPNIIDTSDPFGLAVEDKDEGDDEKVSVDKEASTTSEDEVEDDKEPVTDEDASDPDDPKPKKKPKKGGFQKRIDELSRQRHEAEARSKALEAENSKLRQTQAKTSHETQKPNIENYTSEQEWAEDYEKWVGQGNQRLANEQRIINEQRHKQKVISDRQTSIQTKTLKAAEKYPDFNEIVNNPDIPSLSEMNPFAYEAVISSDAMADLAYYLANNVSEVYELKSQSPIQAVKTIAKLEMKLSKTKPIANLTKASAPTSKISGKTTAKKNPDDMSIKEWMSYERNRMTGN